MTTRPSAWLAGASLRVRVMAAAALLVSITSALTGFLGTTLLHRYLIGRDDAQITTLARVAGSAARQPPVPPSRRPRLPSNFVVYATGGDSSVAQAFGEPQPGTPLPHLSAAQLNANVGPVTVPGAGHQWLVLVRPLAPGQHLVVALTIDDVDSTVGQLALIDTVAGAVGIAVLAFAGLLLIRASLAPLARIEETAEAIATGNLSERIDHPGTRTEIGRLAAVLNAMLGKVEAAYLARAQGEAHAKDSEDRMRRFVADASHELRTPLTSIRGLAQFGLQQGGAASHAELTRLLASIEREAARMGLLVDDLLLLAQLDQDRPLDMHPVDLVSLAAEAVHAAQAVQPGRPITLLSGPDLVIVRADAARLRQVIDNLIGNALRHTPADTPVTVRVAAGLTDGDLTIADRGPGMSAEQAARVFERFYRTDSARSRASGGTGLGLSIVAALVAAHGGTITLDTSPGRGAAFRVRLPLSLT